MLSLIGPFPTKAKLSVLAGVKISLFIYSICGGILVTVGAMSGMLAKRVSWMERDTSSAHNYKALKNFFNCESINKFSRF